MSPFQEFDPGSLVTYRDENLLEYIKETLYSKTNFFYVSSIDWIDFTCEISNGIDSVKTSPDQLIEVVSYLEEISSKKNNFTNSKIENIIREKYAREESISYLIEDQRISICLEDSEISKKYFDLVDSFFAGENGMRKYRIVKFKESIISDLF